MSADLHLKTSLTRTRQARKKPCPPKTHPSEETVENLLEVMRGHVSWKGKVIRPRWKCPFGLPRLQQYLLLLLYVNPGLCDRQLVMRTWSPFRESLAGPMIAIMRRLKNDGFVIIRYEPMICYYLSVLGIDVINILTGDER